MRYKKKKRESKSLALEISHDAELVNHLPIAHMPATPLEHAAHSALAPEKSN